jgi:hypothetical protein
LLAPEDEAKPHLLGMKDQILVAAHDPLLIRRAVRRDREDGLADRRALASFPAAADEGA